ncbi:flavin reductase family protein [Actinomadura decatromicini]|uniref:Flavin reductase family protein n=1 Tax=Actinomadura decatromicini TaxID=2604572 RepID=A0A5D3FGL6_9ACTN|nr:flavin reductase family protein [Actinomadura decatromicini]TYK46980.1 flavin reductase family protein [Actinomadura decatromicini]
MQEVTEDVAVLRRTFGCFPSGVTAVCALVDGTPAGMAASTFTSVSLAPPLVSICVQNTSETWPRLRHAPRLGLSVLAENHNEACLRLSRKEGNRFNGVDWEARPGGGVFVLDATAWLDCRLHDEIPAGDHVIVLLEVLSLAARPETPPLVFHTSRFRRLAPV